VLALYKLAGLCVGVFMFYRFYRIFKPLTEWVASNKVYAIALLGMVLAVLIVFRIIWIFIYRFIDIKPDLEIKEIIAGMIGAVYGVMWMAVVLKALHYFEYKPILDVIGGTFSERYIMPLPLLIYKAIVTIGGKVFSGGKIYET